MVGTTNKSMAAMSGAWLCKKVRHPWLGGPRRLTMYLATLDCATSTPSLSSSPWMRGAPHSGFSTLIRRINARSSASTCGRPPNERLWTDDRDDLQNRRKPSIQLDKEHAIAVRKPDAPIYYPPQHNHLVPERSIFGFKLARRL